MTYRTDEQGNDHTSRSRYTNPPLVQYFSIHGLYGYRNIAFHTNNIPSILIAKNGSGKTTLLAALNAVLSGRLSRLLGINFKWIQCELRDCDETISIHRSELELAYSVPDDSEFKQTAARLNISPAALVRFISDEWYDLEHSNAYENATYNAFLSMHGHRRSKIKRAIEDLQQKLLDRVPSLSRTVRILQRILSNYDVLYLPTYRRVELSLREDKTVPKYRRKRPQFDLAQNSLYSGDIQFGLSDIAERLSELNEQITYTSNSEYRRISAAIISDFLDGTFNKHKINENDIPSRDDLQLLFSRVESMGTYGPHYPITIPNIERLYNNAGMEQSERKFLNYFLTQLNRVVRSTKEVEGRAEQFVSVCNNYLRSEDKSTQLFGEHQRHRIDAKKLILDRNNLSVGVFSSYKEKPITLDALSSGEKQMISLFAKLFLYEKQKLVLIDEPELSLSIEWQRKILVDVVNSPLCEQLIAITHSPFVFENELDPFAGSLILSTSDDDYELDLISDEDHLFESDVF